MSASNTPRRGVGPLTAVIADDEPLGRQALRRFLSTDSGIQIIAEVGDVLALCALLAHTTPDLLLLDITMPGGSGLDAVSHVAPTTAVVFTTAHSEHAATAYAIDAVDYLVKPFGSARVHDALQRVRRWRSALETPAAHGPPVAMLLVRIGTRLIPVATRDIWRLEGADDCVRVVTAERSLLHGATLQELEAQLDSTVFIRAHRRHLVNMTHVVVVTPCDDRRLTLTFPDETSVDCSRAGSAAVRRMM